MVSKDEIPELVGALIGGACEEDLEAIEARYRDALHWGGWIPAGGGES